MEELKRFSIKALETARLALPKHFFGRWLLPCAASMLLACGLPFNAALYSGLDAPVLPLAALAFTGAVWCAFGLQSFFTALLALAAGSAATGAYSGCIAAALLLIAGFSLHSLRPKAEPSALVKLAALLVSTFAAMPAAALFGVWEISLSGALMQLPLSALCALLASILTHGLGTLAPFGGGKEKCAENSVLHGQSKAAVHSLSEAARHELGLVSLALLGGLLASAFSHSRLFSLELGTAAAALFCLVAARSCGLCSIACAAVIASTRVLALNGDMLLVAVLCMCTLSAALLRPLGRWGVLAGFAAPSIALYCFIPGFGTVSPAELLLCGSVFLLADIRPLPVADAFRDSAREEALEKELRGRSSRLSMLSQVLSEMAGLFDGEDPGPSGLVNKQLSGVADGLARLAEGAREGGERYRIGFGAAECPGAGGEQTGDTACIRELDRLSLAAISDGMGTGEAARRESEQTVNMVADLVACGLPIDSAAELVNRLLLIKEGGETYATLDAMLFDRASGSVIAAKHGAPASYILRHGRLNALSAEALPVGIVEEAKTAVFRVHVKRGDVLIMMSDGVSDALGDRLCEALLSTCGQGDPEAAANALIERARRMGGADDMTAIVAMVG
ncbi:MAG: SpoIIE family protein phosphatase [Clostridia bacterium]|nr:SpoIIE family protein phosphatase [Clostridia bacterium]